MEDVPAKPITSNVALDNHASTSTLCLSPEVCRRNPGPGAFSSAYIFSGRFEFSLKGSCEEEGVVACWIHISLSYMLTFIRKGKVSFCVGENKQPKTEGTIQNALSLNRSSKSTRSRCLSLRSRTKRWSIDIDNRRPRADNRIRTTLIP